MKKLFLSLVAIAAMVFASSCQQEKMEAELQGGSTVTFTVEMPAAAATRAVGEADNVDNLVYAVYRVLNTNLTDDQAKETLASNPDDFQLIYQEDTQVITQNNGKKTATVSLELINDQRYVVIFWAQKGYTWFGQGDDFRTVSYPANLDGNNDAYDAFSGVSVVSVDGSVSKNITLVRPFAQVNIATAMPSTERYPNFKITNTKVTVAGLASSFNIGKQTGVTPATPATTVFAEAAPLTEQFSNATYPKYISMNYIFVPENQSNVVVSYVINTNDYGTVKNTVSNVPVARNYRTNIIGNLLTSDVKYNVELAPWETNNNSGTTEVIVDGIVKNQNGDYEVTTANGFAHAINNLFADGGTFYIHPGTYDFTGLVVEPKPTKDGAILNVKANEVPVVTRSTPGFKIIGLDVDYLVSEVVNNSQAIFSGLVLPEDTKLVGTNNGVVGVSGCSNEDTNVPAKLIGSGNGKVVNTVSMATVDDIKAAMEQGLKLIELTGDITDLSEIFVISTPVTIDGCGHKLTSKAARAINVDGADGVTIKNLTIEAAGERAINVINKATNVTIDNVTATAANYTVNVAASAPRAVVNIKNSTLNGCNTVNVAAPNTKVAVNNSTINCNDNNTTAGEAYSALCLNKAAVGAEIIAENTVVNVTEGSDSSKGRNGAEDGTVIINGSTEGVTITVAAITYPDSDYYYGFESLEAAIEFAKEDDVITLIRNITIDEPLVIEEGKTVVLDLNGKTLSNPNDYVFENYSKLTISGEGSIAGLGGIRSHAGKVTINGGTYTASSSWKNNTYQHILKAVNTEVTINGGVFTPTVSEGSNAMINVSENSTVTIKGGKFSNVNNGETIPQFAPYMFTYEKNGKLIIEDGTFYGGWRFNGETATTDIYGGDFTVSYDGQSFHANSTHVLTIYGGTFSLANGGKLNPESYLAKDFKVQKNDNVYTVVPKTYVAKIGENGYETLAAAVADVEDGGTITLVADEIFTETNRCDNGGWWDGLAYSGDKSFTIDLGGYTIKQDGSLNDYLIWIKNDGAKANTITFKNGTMDAGTTAYSALATASSNAQKMTVNLENINLINNISNGAVVKARGGSELNVKAGTVITGKDSYVGIEAVGNNTVVNVYEGAEIYQNGTTSYVGAIIGASYNATLNIMGGKGKSAKCGIIVMSTGATINVSGGEWTANNDGTVAGDNNAVLVSQNNRYETGWACKSILNVTGGTFKGGYNCYGMGPGVEADDAQINISGGNFNADPSAYLVDGKAAVKGENDIWTLIDAVTSEEGLKKAFEQGGEIVLGNDITVAETLTLAGGKTAVLDLNGNTLSAADMNVVKNDGGNLTIKNGTVTRTGDVVGYSVNNAAGEITVENATIQRGLYTSGSKMTATNATISHEQSSRHAIYAWNCEVTINSGTFHNDNAGNATLMASGSSQVTINGGTFSIADGRSTLGWTSCMIDQNGTAEVTVKGGLFNGGFRINSADTKLTIKGGEFNTNNGSGYTDYSGTKVVEGGKFTDAGAQNWAKKYIAEGYEMNANGVVVAK